MVGRRLLVIIAGSLLAVQIVRNAAVQALVGSRPEVAAQMWSGNPQAELSLGMTEIGKATHIGRPIDSSTFTTIKYAAAKAPLAAEPYLVRGVQAQLAGNGKTAEKAFSAAEMRDPRSLPAHYFLASYYFRTGDALNGLREFADLARLTPGGSTSVAPYMAAYAKDRSNWPELRQLFRNDARLQDVALAAMARDPATVDAALALAEPAHRTPSSEWLRILLRNLVDQGQYAKARSVWESISGVRSTSGQLVYDAGFSDSQSPSPFNWSLTTSTIGLAERQPGGRLHLLFYGQQDGVLASQLLMLPPGTYRMSMQVAGSQKQLLGWSLTCGKSPISLSTIGLDALSGRPWIFAVPPGCAAQRLDLSGTSGDMAQQADVTISGLSLRGGQPNG